MPKKGQRWAIEQEPEVRPTVHAPTNAAAGVVCSPHLERTGEKVQAFKVIAGTPMCERCWKNKTPPVLSFLAQKPVGARSLNAKVFTPVRNATQQGRCQSASP
jgi:hypothetical protein